MAGYANKRTSARRLMAIKSASGDSLGRLMAIIEAGRRGAEKPHRVRALTAGVAQMEHARIQDRTRSEQRRLRAQGKFVEGQPPYGYKRAEGTGRDKPRTLEIDPSRAEIVKFMFERCIEGWSIGQIVRHLRATEVNDILFDPSWCSRMLRNRVYTGKISIAPVRPKGHGPTRQLPGEWVDAHPAIIPTEMFERAQAALEERRQHHGARAQETSSTALYLLRSISWCAICNSRCTIAGGATADRHKRRGYYVCRARLHPDKFYPPRERCIKAPYVRREEADAAMEKAMQTRLSVLPSLLSLSIRERPAPNFDKKRRELLSAKQRLVDAVAMGALKMSDILAKSQEIDAKLTTLEIDARDYAANASADTPENRKAVRAFVEAVAAHWPELSVDEPRTAIVALAERVAINAEGEVIVDWRNPANLAPSVATAHKELGDRLGLTSRHVA